MTVIPRQQSPSYRFHATEHARPGAGLRVTRNALGEIYSGTGGGMQFIHPWRCALSAAALIFTAGGTVRSVSGAGPITPTILYGGQQVPMMGKTGTQPTPLKLDPSVQNAQGESWAALEVTPDPTTGQLLDGALCQIVHGNVTTSSDPKLGRTPLAQILWRGNSPALVQEIAFFNLLYQRIIPGPGGGVVSHFFL